jgi:hypothetical protein
VTQDLGGILALPEEHGAHLALDLREDVPAPYGRVVSGKLAESQFIGGMIMGMGQALLEAVRIDPRKWPDPQQQPRYAVRA